MTNVAEHRFDEPAGSDNLSAAISLLGYQPFIALSVDHAASTKVFLCETQNGVDTFVDRLRSSGLTEQLSFVDGLCLALKQQSGAAADRLADWIDEGEQVSIEVPAPDTTAFANSVGYPLLRITTDDSGDDRSDARQQRAAALSTFVSAFSRTAGNDFMRWVLCETAALALAAKADTRDIIAIARGAVDDALGCVPDSPSLAAVQAQLGNAAVDEAPATSDAMPAGAANSAAEALYTAIEQNGHQPLFSFSVQRSGEAPHAILCGGAYEVAAFVRELRARAGQNGFAQGFAAALDREIYDAAGLWFDWLGNPVDPFAVSIELLDEGAAPFPNANGYPLLHLAEFASGKVPASPDAKAALLGAMFNRFESIAGNEPVRNLILEGAAFALSKYYGQFEKFDIGLDFVRRALQHIPRSIHLKAAENAIERRLLGEPVPERLLKFIGPDNGALRDRICRLPFTRFDIGPSGDVLMCCGHWLPTSIGNFIGSSIDDILNSQMAQKIRASMLDGSYKYCNHLECGAMVQDTLPRQSETHELALRAAIDEKKVTLEGVDEVLFAFDQTCNLSCPSCRTQRILERPSQNEAKAEAVERNLVPILPKLKTLHINPAGEFLSSKPSRRLLELINRETCPDLGIEIISNGTLFSRREWAKFPNIHDMVRTVRVSVDGCTKPTFEALRRLADFDIFCENMRFLAELRASGALPELKFSFTYQLGNFREMKDFVHFARGFNCDFVIFERLQNLGTFTNAEFRERAVHLNDHPLHDEFLAMVRDPVFRHPCVWHEFEWEGTAVHHSAEDRMQWHLASVSVPGVEPVDALS